MDKGKTNIYIDESGIHRTTLNSTFVLVYIKTGNNDVLKQGIEKIENDLKIPHFHWADFGSRKGWTIRRDFILACANLPFTFKYVVAKNPVNSTKELFHSITSLLVERDVDKIFIDGKQPKWYERQIKKTLRDSGISVRQLKTVRDQAVPAIRLADALAGLIRLYFDNPQGLAQELFNRIKRNHLQ